MVRWRLTVCVMGAFLLLGAGSGLAQEPCSVQFTNSLGMQFVHIPAGSFRMGSPADEPKRDGSETPYVVTISKPFLMQTTEVTLKQWRRLMGRSWLLFRQGGSNSPVTRVSWREAQKFIDKLNTLGEGRYRLPTEAEWEYAARAGTASAYPWGDEIDCTRAMFGNNPAKEDTCVDYAKSRNWDEGRAAPVGNYPANPWGLHDMHGNVWEWVADWFGEYPQDPQTDPTGPNSGTMRGRRGGSWFKYGFFCRSANRTAAHPDARLKTTGFRVVREVTADH